jgi:asparagine synthase (glutamine-hydrolysing)
MCGIVGLWHFDRKPINPRALQQATTLLRHRGPDDEGYLLVDTEKGCASHFGGNDTLSQLHLPRIENAAGQSSDLVFGFRRLSILDLSPTGHQPMVSVDGSCWIIYNGEIYNYLELRAELSQHGYQFRTASDTEVILAAYQHWGEECLARFNGMWAFTLWDNHRRQLFCARDRFGIKPFYFFRDNNIFAFASEIKALLKIADLPRRPNDPIIYDYLHNGYLDHTGETFFAGIQQLLPAHTLILQNGKLLQQRYWNLDSKRHAPATNNAEESEKFYTLFEDAVRLHLRSDVPIGTCLSGGLDSSAIVCVANKLLFTDHVANRNLIGKQQKTFSACFDDENLDERKYIEQVLAATGAEQNYTFPNGSKLLDILPHLIWHQDEPFASTSLYAQWCVMEKAAERGVKVLLDGQGGDELLAGYPGYFSYYCASLFRHGRWVEFWREARAYKNLRGVSLAQIFWWTARLHLPAAARAWIDRARQDADWGLHSDFLQQHRDRGLDFVARKHGNLFDDFVDALLTRYSLPALLRYEDRNAMAFSIEARVPFLDYRLAEYAFALPDHQKIHHGLTKFILRNAMQKILPESVRLRTDKMGFNTPERRWLANELNGLIRELIHSPSFAARGYFNASQIAQAFAAHVAGQRDLTFRAWRWINLELWFRQMIDAAE